MHFGVLRKESWPTHKEQKIMIEKNMKNEKPPQWFLTEAADQKNKIEVIDWVKFTREWQKKALKVISQVKGL